jgi:hypothetical protein
MLKFVGSILALPPDKTGQMHPEALTLHKGNTLWQNYVNGARDALIPNCPANALRHKEKLATPKFRRAAITPGVIRATIPQAGAARLQ